MHISYLLHTQACMCDAYMQRVCVGSCIYVLVCVGVLVRVGDLALL